MDQRYHDYALIPHQAPHMIAIYDVEMSFNDVHPSASSAWELHYGYHNTYFTASRNMFEFVLEGFKMYTTTIIWIFHWIDMKSK